MDDGDFNAYTQRHGEEPTASEQFGQDLYNQLNDDTVFGQIMAGAISGMAESAAEKINSFGQQNISSYANPVSHTDHEPTPPATPSPDAMAEPISNDNQPSGSHFSQRMAEIQAEVANDNTPSKTQDMEM